MPAQSDILDRLDLTRRRSAAALRTASDDLRSIRGQISASKEGISDSHELLAWVEREMVRAKPNGNLRWVAVLP
jgi:hypothetical protein